MILGQSTVRETEAIATKSESVMIPPPMPFFRALRAATKLWAFKSFYFVLLGTIRYFKLFGVDEFKATYSKTYPHTYGLVNDIWIPKDHKSGTPLPLYIDIRGGEYVPFRSLRFMDAVACRTPEGGFGSRIPSSEPPSLIMSYIYRWIRCNGPSG